MGTVKRSNITRRHRVQIMAHQEVIRGFFIQGYTGSDIWRIMCDDYGLTVSYSNFMLYVKRIRAEAMQVKWETKDEGKSAEEPKKTPQEKPASSGSKPYVHRATPLTTEEIMNYKRRDST